MLTDLTSTSPTVVDDFALTQSDVDNEEVLYRALVRLRPDRLSIDELMELVFWVEGRVPPREVPRPHVAVFGTGGDQTVNISTPAAIIASRCVPVWKVGTHGVTSRYGSVDFLEALQRRLPRIRKTDIRRAAWFADGSGPISLGSLGFPYRASLRNARRRLWREGIPDVYKVVFPFANYTFPEVQINGCRDATYRKLFFQLACRTGRHVWTIASELNIDELAPGRNLVTRIRQGESSEQVVTFGNEWDPQQVRSALAEKRTADDHVELFLGVLAGTGDPVYRETVLWNAALIVQAGTALTLEQAYSMVTSVLSR